MSKKQKFIDYVEEALFSKVDLTEIDPDVLSYWEALKGTKDTEKPVFTDNGKLVMENKRYNKNIYEEFTTSVPGVYEITYNLSYMHYGDNGQSELITSDPLKLKIKVEATPPIVVAKSNTTNYTNIVLIISLLASTLFILVLSKKSKKKF